MPTDAFESVFRPYIDRQELEFGRRHLRLPDGGEAELYCGDLAELDCVMVSRFSLGMFLDLLTDFLRRVDSVILAPGGPTLMVDPAQAAHLPAELADDVAVVSSGTDIQNALQLSYAPSRISWYGTASLSWD